MLKEHGDQLPTSPFQHNRYCGAEFLGGGGFGTVYRARDEKLQRDVALKILSGQSQDAYAEAKALARINCPHVVKVYDVFQEDNQVAIVMELVKTNEVLSLDSLKSMSLDRFLSFYSELLQAITSIHAADILHLDIKLSNILLNEKGQVKLADFGISQIDNQSLEKSQANSCSTSKGSWFCLAPEQLNREKVSSATDIFALGILLHYYIYHEHPFLQPEDLTQSKKNISQAKLRSPQKNPHVPNTQLMQLAGEMLNKHAKKRPCLESVIKVIDSVKSEEKAKQAKIENTLTEQTITLDLPEEKSKKHMVFIVVGAVICFSVIIGFIYNYAFQSVLTTLVVPPQQIAHDGFYTDIKSKDNNLLTSVIIEDEIEAAVIDDSKRRLVSKKEWRGSRNWEQEANQVGVDEIIYSTVDCGEVLCNVKLGIYNRAKNKTIRFIKKDIPVQPITVFGQVINQILHKSLGLESKKKLTNDISNEDLKAYTIYKNKLETSTFENTELSKLYDLAERNPEFAGASLLLGIALIENFRTTKDTTWLDKAQALVVQMSQRFPNDPTVLELEFKLYIKQENLTAAEQTLNRLKGQVGLDLDELSLSNALLTFKKNPTQGYKNLLGLPSPRLTHSYYHYKTYMEDCLGEYHVLRDTAKDWRQRFPESKVALFFLANSYLSLGPLKSAIEAYKELSLLENDYASLNNLGLSHFLLGDYKQSKEIYMKALAISPDLPESSLYLAEALKAQGDPNSEYYFLESLKKFQQLTSPSGSNYAYQALALAHLKRKEEATIALQKAATAMDVEEKMFYWIAAHVHNLIDNPQAAFFNAKIAREKGFYNSHWFNLPWTQKLYKELSSQGTQP